MTGRINYLGPMTERPRFHANDHSRDRLVLESHAVTIEDARRRAVAPSLDREGFALVPHQSAIHDFHDRDDVQRLAPSEIDRLIRDLTGADAVAMFGMPLLRFGERSPESGALNNSLPARFVHIDGSDARLAVAANELKPKGVACPIARYTFFNIWRVLSPPPQDIPLAICDARSVAPDDPVAADAVFDYRGQPEWTAESLVVRPNPAHRWAYFPGMNRDEALVFVTKNSDPARPHHVPHCAFDDPSCPPGVPPRASVEMRAIAYWFG